MGLCRSQNQWTCLGLRKDQPSQNGHLQLVVEGDPALIKELATSAEKSNCFGGTKARLGLTHHCRTGQATLSKMVIREKISQYMSQCVSSSPVLLSMAAMLPYAGYTRPKNKLHSKKYEASE